MNCIKSYFLFDGPSFFPTLPYFSVAGHPCYLITFKYGNIFCGKKWSLSPFVCTPHLFLHKYDIIVFLHINWLHSRNWIFHPSMKKCATTIFTIVFILVSKNELITFLSIFQKFKNFVRVAKAIQSKPLSQIDRRDLTHASLTYYFDWDCWLIFQIYSISQIIHRATLLYNTSSVNVRPKKLQATKSEIITTL